MDLPIREYTRVYQAVKKKIDGGRPKCGELLGKLREQAENVEFAGDGG